MSYRWLGRWLRLFGQSAQRAEVDYGSVDHMTDRQVFDYFASELFDSADAIYAIS